MEALLVVAGFLGGYTYAKIGVPYLVDHRLWPVAVSLPSVVGFAALAFFR